MPPHVLSILVGAATRTGGPPPFVGGSARELTRLGASMRVLSTDIALAPAGWLQRQQRVRPEDVHPTLRDADLALFPARFPRRLAHSPALRRALRDEVPRSDVVHLHNLWQYPQFAGHRAARAAGVPYIVSPHGGLDPYIRRHGRARKAAMSRLWQDRMFREAALLHVTTTAELELTADVAPEVPRELVPPGIYMEDFAELPPPELFRQRHLGGRDAPVVLFLGRLAYKKGLDVLIRAFSVLRSSQEAVLAIAGPDDEALTPGLERLAQELSVDADVIFTGPVYGEDRLAALAAADVWALSSHAENFGIAVVEAMAAGCPAVISPGVNLAADIGAAEAGLVAELEPEAFGEALARPLSDRALHERLRETGRSFASGYDWSVIGPRMLQMYERCLAGRGPSLPRR